MKLVCLNIWGGKQTDSLKDFIQKQVATTDFFLFQEVFSNNKGLLESNGSRLNILAEIQELAPNFQSFFSPSVYRRDTKQPVDGLSFGLMTMVSPNHTCIDHGDRFIYLSKEQMSPAENNSQLYPRTLQYTTLQINNRKLSLINLHGLWTPTKLDTPDRMQQSNNIARTLNNLPGEIILGGDFNLRPETQSIQLLESKLKNLIKAYAIETTRSGLYTGFEPFADYMFVSEGIKVQEFLVPDLSVSDHRPMIISFEL